MLPRGWFSLLCRKNPRLKRRFASDFCTVPQGQFRDPRNHGGCCGVFLTQPMGLSACPNSEPERNEVYLNEPGGEGDMHVARVYLRVSTQGEDLDRQESIIAEARDAGYCIAGVYREKASGARADRPELLRLIADLQPGEVVVAEKIDRISRLPLPEAEKLIETIRNKGARLAVPGVVDLSDIAASADGVAQIVLESIQEMLLKLALQMARDDFEDRRERQRQRIALAKADGDNT